MTVHGIDLIPKPDIEVIADLCHLPVRGRVADVVWCHHVLEHIENDDAAMAELTRVLKPDAGELVVSVPMVPGPTVEFGFADRQRNGHWRMYGDDFVERLTAAGLVVEPVQLALDPTLARRYRIRSLSFYRCRAMQSQ